jgi:DNA-binding CsgD family transcriptional regulator
MNVEINKAIPLSAKIYPSRRSAQFKNFEAESIESSAIASLRFAEQLFPQKLFMLCPISHPTFSYVSESCQTVLGYSAAEMKVKTVGELIDLIHPEDIDSFMRCLSYVEKFEPYDPTQYRILTHYRLKNKEGNYVQICDEKIGLQSQSGKYIYLAVLHDVSKEQKTSNVKVEILKKYKSGFLKLAFYNPMLEENNITPRQGEIINLIKRGFTNKEIADILHVSIYTVKNHKQALFKKRNVSSSLELASLEFAN